MIQNITELPQPRLNLKLISRRVIYLAKKLLASNLTFLFIATSFLPQTGGSVLRTTTSEAEITVQEPVSSIIPLRTAQYPLAYNYVSQGYSPFHPGIDFAAEYGTDVKPIREGVVEEAGYSLIGYGYMVLVNHESGITSLYGHLSKILVQKGEKIDKDTILGKVGSTGRSTGPHLHLEIRKDEKPLNPFSFLPLPSTEL